MLALQIKQEVENVLKHAKLSGDQESEPKQEDTAREETKKTSGDKRGEKTNEKKSVDKKQQKVQKGDFRGSFGFRRDSNPDVVYGEILMEKRFRWRALPVRWVRLSSDVRLWMWKLVRSEMRKRS